MAWSVPAPSLDDIAALAEAAFASLPAPFRAACGRVVFRIADFAEEDVLDDLGIEDPFALSGVYSGAPLASDLGVSPALMPSEVWLFRRPILDEWAANGEVSLDDLVRHVLIHEVGHHLGLSDEDIEAIEYAP
jgi:predicted Zn-dependent protease with MMP-like domain